MRLDTFSPIVRKIASATMAMTLLATMACGFIPASMAAPASVHEYRPGQIIMQFRKGVSQTAQNQFLGKMHARVVHKYRLSPGMLVQVPQDRPLPVWVRTFKASPLVKYADPNYIVKMSASGPDDPYFTKQWGLNNKNNKDIDAPQAWTKYNPQGSMIVAVLDTGCDYNHKELQGNIWLNMGEDANNDGQITAEDINGIDDDTNGYIDDFRGWDFVNWDRNPMDDNGHGTHVSGIIAAKGDNKYGVVGMAGKGDVMIMPLKFLDHKGQGDDDGAIQAIEYATANGAILANNSWGGSGYNAYMESKIDAYQRLGGLFIVAAGNTHENLSAASEGSENLNYPAAFNMPGMIVVAATNASGNLASFSNYGRANVHLAAPGTNILSTVPKNRFAYYDGTSQATPYVTGVAAMVWNQNTNLNSLQVKQILLNSVRTTDTLTKTTITGGILNASKALDQAGTSAIVSVHNSYY